MQLQLTFVKVAQRVNTEQAASQGLQWAMPVSRVLQEGTLEMLELLTASSVNQANSFPRKGQLFVKEQHVQLGSLVRLGRHKIRGPIWSALIVQSGNLLVHSVLVHVRTVSLASTLQGKGGVEGQGIGIPTFR